jgi:F0F1-type ATP synthase membrane subunit b/b'
MLSLDANFVVVFLIVWILVFALSKLFFNPVRRVRDSRDKGIMDKHQAYEKALEAYEKTLQDIEVALKQARAAAESIRDSLEAEALKEKNRLLAEIGAEYRSQVDQARASLDETVKNLKGKLELDASSLAEKIEKKFLN